MASNVSEEVKKFFPDAELLDVEEKNNYDRFLKKILEKAKELEKKMKESQEAIKKIEVTGNSGGDLVKVKLNGEGEMVSVEILRSTFKRRKKYY